MSRPQRWRASFSHVFREVPMAIEKFHPKMEPELLI